MLSISRQGQLYVIKEVTQGVTPALAATNAWRHKAFTVSGDNKNKRTILVKKQSPWTSAGDRTAQRKQFAANLESLLLPSGTLNTVPECDPGLEAAFGAKTNVVLATTVNAGTGVVGGATLASVVGLAVNGPLLITCPDGKKRIRFINTLPGAGAVTWRPNLPAGQAPADGAAVKSGLLYKLSKVNVITLSAAHYLKKSDLSAGLKRVVSMWPIDKLSMLFDANNDPIIKLSGPAKDMLDAPAQPGGFTMVGTQPPSGLTGELMIGNTAMKFLKMGIDITNGMWLRNDEYGFDSATEALRKDRASVMLSIDSRVEDEATLYDLAEAGTNALVFKQTGFTEGNCMAVLMPQVEFKIPETDDPDDVANWPFKAEALESADDQNDNLFLALC